jgi:hypothetical protein
MDQTSAHTFTEIAVCSGAGDRLQAYSASDASGRTVQRLDRIDVWNQQAKHLCAAMLRVLCKQHSLDPLNFEIQPQIWADPADGGGQGLFRTGWALLVRTTAAQVDDIETYRRDAWNVAALLRRSQFCPRRPSPTDAAAAAPDPVSELTLEHLAGEPLLGARLKTSIDVLVAGAPALRLTGVLRRRAVRTFSTETVSITRARLRLAKLDGRTHYVAVTGTEASTGEKFTEDRVRFDATWLKQIAAAIEHPSDRLVMQIVRETLDSGRAKPRHHYKLIGLVVASRSEEPSRSHVVGQFAVA